MATYGYCRVSTLRQANEGESLDVQSFAAGWAAPAPEGRKREWPPAAVSEAWCAYSARPSFRPPEPPGRQGGASICGRVVAAGVASSSTALNARMMTLPARPAFVPASRRDENAVASAGLRTRPNFEPYRPRPNIRR
jgi:hypothetical protein